MLGKREHALWLALALLLGGRGGIQAATYVVRPDGLGDFPTIQAALDAVQNGDVIELADGTFSGAGNRDLDFLGKTLTVRSQSGTPEVCTIDCEGSETTPHRGFIFQNLEGPAARLEDITITGGWGHIYGPKSAGGALLCADASPTVSGCIFAGNYAEEGGAIMACAGGAPTLIDCRFIDNSACYGGAIRVADSCDVVVTACEFYGNSAENDGGAFNCRHTAAPRLIGCHFEGNLSSMRGGAVLSNDYSQPVYAACTFVGNHATTEGGAATGCGYSTALFDGCTFEGNSSLSGAAISCGCEGYVTVERSILAFGLSGASVHWWGSGVLTLACCNIFGNVGGDWIECILDQYGVAGNFSADPQFCDAAAGDLSLHQDSPCVAGNHPQGTACGMIGACPVGCPLSPVVDGAHAGGAYGITRCAPNPLRGGTWITYRLPEAAAVRLEILDPAGRVVGTLDAPRDAGRHSVHWDGRGRPAGSYYCRLSWNGRTTTRPLRLVR